MRPLILLLASVFGLVEVRADTYPKNLRVDVINYRFALDLQDQNDRISGTADVDLRFVAEGETSLRFDLVNRDNVTGRGMTVSAVSADGASLVFAHRDNALTITLPRRFEPGQRLRLQIAYSGEPVSGLKIANNRHGDRTFFSDNWPDKARHWLPTVDHPYDKATSEMIVTAPAHYQVVSNGLLVEETDLPGGRRRTHWRQAVPIAPWLYVLGVARFAVQHVDTFQGKAIQTWVYAQDRDAGFYDFAVPTRDVLEFYSEKVGPFSYEKLANVQSNSVSGGMEAASAIFYSEGSVTGDRSVRWRNVVIHEIAHQWFGNAVTESDWDDVWLSEGFATYFTLLYIEHAHGRDEFLSGLEASRKRVIEFDQQRPDYRVVHDNLNDMSQVTTGQIYQKGAWILHMLRGMIGDEAFWSGIRSYYRAHQDGHATTADFRGEMERASGRDLRLFFDQWLTRGGLVRLDGDWSYRADTGTLAVRLTQRDRARTFAMPLQVGVYTAGSTTPTVTTVPLSEASHEFQIAVGQRPDRVVLDPNHFVLMESDFVAAKR
ncbi:MAG: M1 family peptidase [Acidobacteria bacterium]|nr:M1 family peptidase [Acidobacteriota bacterium]